MSTEQIVQVAGLALIAAVTVALLIDIWLLSSCKRCPYLPKRRGGKCGGACACAPQHKER